MPDEEQMDEAIELFEEMYREEAYVETTGSQVAIKFDDVRLEVDLWNGNLWVLENGEEVFEDTSRY